MVSEGLPMCRTRCRFSDVLRLSGTFNPIGSPSQVKTVASLPLTLVRSCSQPRLNMLCLARYKRYNSALVFTLRRMDSLAVIVLAAGQGTRMKSDLPKVLHPLAGKPLLM